MHGPPRLPLGGRAAPVYRCRRSCHQSQDRQDDEHLRQGKGEAGEGPDAHREREKRPGAFRTIVTAQEVLPPGGGQPQLEDPKVHLQVLGRSQLLERLLDEVPFQSNNTHAADGAEDEDVQKEVTTPSTVSPIAIFWNRSAKPSFTASFSEKISLSH